MASFTPLNPKAGNGWPAPYIIYPLNEDDHTTTLILLHGTSTDGPTFAKSLLEFGISSSSSSSPSSIPPAAPPIESPTPTFTSVNASPPKITAVPGEETLRTLFPTTKFVFPTGKSRRVSVLGGREANAWFDFPSFSDRTLGEDVQVEGLRESAVYLAGVVKSEVDVFARFKDGEGEEDEGGEGRGEGRVVIGGFSQGCAMIVSLLLGGELERQGVQRGDIGGVVGMSGWCPLRGRIERAVLATVIKEDPTASVAQRYSDRRRVGMLWLRKTLGLEKYEPEGEDKSVLNEDMKIWIGQGEDDEKVRLEWSEQMRDLVLNLGGVKVRWDSYKGLGHWFSERELSDLGRFLEGVWVEFLFEE